MTTLGQTGQGAALPAATAHLSDRLRAIVEHQPACLAEVAADGRVLAMNAAQVTLMGSHGGGRLYHDLVSLTDRERMADFIREVTEGNPGALEYLMVTPDAGSCDVVTDGVPLDRGEDHGVVALLVTRDLTEYRDLERRIQSAEERAANAVSDGVAEHRQEGVAADEDVPSITELEAQVQAAEDRARAALTERDAERERVEQMTQAHAQHSVELAARIEAAEEHARKVAADRDAERKREGLVVEADARGASAEFETQVQAAEERAQTALAERDAERERVEQVTQEHAKERVALEARLEAVEERERTSVAARAVERKRVAQALDRARVQLLEMKHLRDQAATSGSELPGGLPVAPTPSHQQVAAMA